VDGRQAPLGYAIGMTSVDRRSFMAALPGVAILPAWPMAQVSGENSAQARPQAAGAKRPIVISSANGLRAVDKAMEMLQSGSDPLDSVVAGINIIEDDPDDMSVGLGGLPNENGVVELDASCMHGPTCKAGAVAALQKIRNPASVALLVLRRTDHVLLVGDGALAFARQMGFKEQNLLTDKSRRAWLKWKRNLNPDDDWLDDDQLTPGGGPAQDTLKDKQSRAESLGVPFTTGTIHCAAVTSEGDLGACTSTSGLSWKLPGRAGDSPIIGAGNFVDNAVGSAGATGRGEAVIQACGSFQVVQHMANSIEPTEACLKILKWIADHTKQKHLLNDKGEPNFGVTFYALRKDGAYGSATMRREKDRTNSTKFAIHDGTEARLIECATLFD
jgi:N4-(beta-N-acetylglucosaminyl)-L-asparaginase